jgi:hypothetical protein
MIRKYGLELVKRVSQELGAANVSGPWRCLSLSYQDVIATPDELVELLGESVAAALPMRPDSARIAEWHKAKDLTGDRIPDWHELLRVFNFDPESVDLRPSRGCESFMDLNHQVRPSYHDRYALVVDNVVHHCFDPAQALRSIVRMPHVGGYVLHITPLVQVNHGFYCLSPTLFHDFYTRNGYEVLAHRWYDIDSYRRLGPPRDMEAATRRMRSMSADSVQLFLARRVEARNVVLIPVQDKFARHPDSLIEKGTER